MKVESKEANQHWNMVVWKKNEKDNQTFEQKKWKSQMPLAHPPI
jgi:hypothetical protein